MSESTVHYIKKAYVEELRKWRRFGDASDMDVFPLKKRGRPLLLGSKLDSKVKETQRKSHVSARIVVEAARGIAMLYDKKGPFNDDLYVIL